MLKKHRLFSNHESGLILYDQLDKNFSIYNPNTKHEVVLEYPKFPRSTVHCFGMLSDNKTLVTILRIKYGKFELHVYDIEKKIEYLSLATTFYEQNTKTHPFMQVLKDDNILVDLTGRLNKMILKPEVKFYLLSDRSYQLEHVSEGALLPNGNVIMVSENSFYMYDSSTELFIQNIIVKKYESNSKDRIDAYSKDRIDACGVLPNGNILVYGLRSTPKSETYFCGIFNVGNNTFEYLDDDLPRLKKPYVVYVDQ